MCRQNCCDRDVFFFSFRRNNLIDIVFRKNDIDHWYEIILSTATISRDQWQSLVSWIILCNAYIYLYYFIFIDKILFFLLKIWCLYYHKMDLHKSTNRTWGDRLTARKHILGRNLGRNGSTDRFLENKFMQSVKFANKIH